MSQWRIPFNRFSLQGAEGDYVREALASGHLSGDGPFTKRCHEWLQRRFGVPRALLTTSCTDALELAGLLLDLKPGDEIIVPSFTFVSTVNAFALRGAVPVFAEVRRDTLNIDESRIEELVTPSTRAIVVVHYAGVGCEMDAICEIAGRHALRVVEDNAHGIFGRYRARPLGTFGSVSALSFHETKNISCGEGGALLINDEALIDRAEILREKGTDRSRLFRGLVDKYTWVDLGSSFLPSELIAAVLLGQLEASCAIQARRRAMWTRYREELGDWAEEQGVRLPVVPPHCEQPYHLFYMLMPDEATRAGLIDHLKKLGILAVFHYLPLHLSPMGRRLGRVAGPLDVTERVSATIVRLPLFNDLSDADQDEIVAAVRSFRTGRRPHATAT